MKHYRLTVASADRDALWESLRTFPMDAHEAMWKIEPDGTIYFCDFLRGPYVGQAILGRFVALLTALGPVTISEETVDKSKLKRGPFG